MLTKRDLLLASLCLMVIAGVVILDKFFLQSNLHSNTPKGWVRYTSNKWDGWSVAFPSGWKVSRINVPVPYESDTVIASSPLGEFEVDIKQADTPSRLNLGPKNEFTPIEKWVDVDGLPGIFSIHCEFSCGASLAVELKNWFVVIGNDGDDEMALPSLIKVFKTVNVPRTSGKL